LGTPAVVLVNEGFGFDARSAASGKGMPNVRVVPETVPCECTIEERIVGGVRAAMDDLVDALTRPLTGEERSPAPREPERTGGVGLQGRPGRGPAVLLPPRLDRRPAGRPAHRGGGAGDADRYRPVAGAPGGQDDPAARQGHRGEDRGQRGDGGGPAHRDAA